MGDVEITARFSGVSIDDALELERRTTVGSFRPYLPRSSVHAIEGRCYCLLLIAL